jgi:hypothetical protein
MILARLCVTLFAGKVHVVKIDSEYRLYSIQTTDAKIIVFFSMHMLMII